MRAKEFLSERFDYSGYIPILSRLVTDIFYATSAADEYDSPAAKVNAFLYELQEEIDDKILTPLLKDNPIVDRGVQIRSLTISFKPTFDSAMGSLNMGKMSSSVQRTLRKQYPANPLPPAGPTTVAQFLKSHIDFTKEADFHVSPDARSAIINIGMRGSEIANYIFLAEDGAIATAGLKTLSSGIAGKLFHELKHFMQTTKVSKKVGTDVDVNRYYTGNPKTMNKVHHYNNTKSGYWLNSDELDSWAANAAAELHNVFGTDVQAMTDYLNATSIGQTINYNGVPVKTTMDSYYQQVFNPRYKMNTPRQDVWRKFVKNVYKDVQMYLKGTSQTQPAMPG
jgi:hypothetical protein